MKVFIITYCRKPELYYGTELIFKTLRIGFPKEEVIILDNASVIYRKTEKYARKVGASFFRIEKEQKHEELIRKILTTTKGEIVLVDPDVVFWEKMNFYSDALISGRLLPKFTDPFTQCVTHARIHTSLLHIKDTQQVMTEIDALEKKYFDFNAINPIIMCREGTWERWDTMAPLYQAKPELFSPFTEQDLDRYDHLFCGSHLDLVVGAFPELGEIHARPLVALKGLWREQEKRLLCLK